MNENKFKPSKEWFNQASYDLETAAAMLKTEKIFNQTKELLLWLTQKELKRKK